MPSAAPTTPSLEQTYYPEQTLLLFSQPPPVLYTDKWCDYGDSTPLTDINDRYIKSIEERVTLPSTPPDLAITLRDRLDSSLYNIPHVWTVHIRDASKPTYPSQLVAKIYDPVWFGDSEWADPFKLRNRSVSQEVESYRRLEPLQGTGVPRFYGHFVTSLPTQHDRTVNVILMEHVEGEDLRHLVPPESADALCCEHKNAVIDAALNLYFDIRALGVECLDMQPRNVILKPPKRDGETQYCSSLECPLRFQVECGNLEMVMVDFEMVEFHPQDLGRNKGPERDNDIQRTKPLYLEKWLENRMV